MAKKIRLQVVKGPAEGLSRTFDKPSVLIGRGDKVDFSIDDDQHVSRMHAAVHVSSDNRLFVEDMGSRTGVFWIGRQIKEKAEIPEGTRLNIGKSLLEAGFAPDGKPEPPIDRSRTEPPPGPRWPKIVLTAAGTAVVCVAILVFGKDGCKRPGNRGVAQTPFMMLDVAVGNRNAGAMQAALTVLEKIPVDEAKDTQLAQKVRALTAECRRISLHIKTAKDLEDSLQLRLAQDEWRLAAENLPAADPFRVWALTNHVERLERRIKELDVSHEPSDHTR